MGRLKGHDRIAFQCLLYQVFARILANRLRLADERLLKARNEIAALRLQADEPRAADQRPKWGL